MGYNVKEKKFSENIFKNSQPLYDDKPNPEKIREEQIKQENEMLPKLSNIEWVVYPFAKTLRAIMDKVCCRKKNA